MTARIVAAEVKYPTAAELLPSLPGIDSWFTTILEDFAAALDERGAFANLSWADARRVAKMIADDITGYGHPRERLTLSARAVSNDDECFDLHNAEAVRRTLVAAAELSASRCYGVRWIR